MNNGNLHNGYKSEASFKGNTETTHNFSDIAIIGASHAGISFANSLRKNSFSGSLTLIDRQTGGPMERPPLSKGFLLETEDKLNPKYLLKRSKWYRDERVTLKNNVIVKEIDTAKKCLNFDDGGHLKYDKLVLATGAIPRTLPASKGIKNVFVLRQPDHAVAIRNAARNAKSAIIIGGGYIGLEVAATFRKLGIAVSVIEVADRLLARVASQPVADLLTDLHHSHGVFLYTGFGIEEISHTDSVFSGVILSDGTKLKGDMLVVGIGVTPDSDLAFQAGLETEHASGGAILVDECQQTSNPNIFSIGDVALQRGSSIRIESVNNAQDSAARAAAAVMGKPRPGVQAPWFWSDQYDANLQSVGIVPTDDGDVYQISRGGGSEKAQSFWSYKKDQLLAVETISDPENFMLGKKCLDKNISPDPELICKSEFDTMAWILKNSA